MCGILGRIYGSNSGESRPPLTAGLEFLGRRGPDSHFEWRSAQSEVELLHARLAIVDTDSRAHQPFTDSRNGITVALNGEIYNYRELRSRLTEYDFKTTSDTEVIIALYLKEGLAGLKLLRGMFAMCIVDAPSRRVYLVRDPIGKKPLFVAKWQGATFFGSSVMAMLAVSGAAVELNREMLPEFWANGHVDPRTSLLRDCEPMAPGQVVEMDWQGVTRGIHSCIPDVSTTFVDQDLTSVHKQISELISESVRRRLSNNPAPVALLSGGIDSTVVTNYMKGIAGGSAITLGSVIPGTHDERFAREAAERIQIPLQTVRARAGRIAEDANWALSLQDEPLGMIPFFPLALMIRAAKDYGRILLTGDGGDEVFLGYGEPKDWIGETSDDHQTPSGDVMQAPHWMSPWGQNMVTNSLVGHMFTKLDRASAEQGVEARCPLLDWDLVTFVRSLRPEQLFFDGRPKALLKAQLDGWPTRFIDRRKIGFAYNLRWSWALTRFDGLRELVSPEAVETFAHELPAELTGNPAGWKTWSIFNNFPAIWKLLAWSCFTVRVRQAEAASRVQASPVSLEAAFAG